MHRAKVAWSSEDVADEYELQLQHELEMLQVNPDSTTSVRVFKKRPKFQR